MDKEEKSYEDMNPTERSLIQSKGLYESMKEGYIQEYKPELTKELIKEVFGTLFKEVSNRPQRQVKVYTNEAGMFLFNLAIVFGTYYTDGVRYWIDVIKDRKGSIRFGYISLFEHGGLYKMKVYPEYSGRKNRFEFYYGTELLGVSDTVEAVKELEYKGPQTPYHIPRAKERERDGYMVESDLLRLGWKQTNEKGPFMQTVWMKEEDDNYGIGFEWIEPMSNTWRLQTFIDKKTGRLQPNMRFTHFHGGGFAGTYNTDTIENTNIERKSELKALMKILRI